MTRRAAFVTLALLAAHLTAATVAAQSQAPAARVPTTATRPDDNAPIVLPNPHLLACAPSACSQLWLEKDPPANGIYPVQFFIDISDGGHPGFPNGTPYAFRVNYPASVSMDRVKAAISPVYGKWLHDDHDTFKAWRIESENFVFGLMFCHKNEPGCDEGMPVLYCIPIGLWSSQTKHTASPRHVVLTNPKLIRCVSPSCPFWLENDPPADAIYPIQLSLDISDGSHSAIQNDSLVPIQNGSPYAFTISYDKTLSIDNAKGALNSVYGNWVFADSGNWPVKLWRIESEKFVIQLSTCSKKLSWCRKDSREMIYIPIGYGHASQASK